MTSLRRLSTVAVPTVALIVGLMLLSAVPAGADPAPSSVPTSAAISPFATVVTTSTTLAAPVQIANSDSSPGLFDLSGHVQKAIDDWFGSLVTSAITPALQLLGRVLLSAPDLTNQPDVRAVWEITLAVADALMVMFALAGGIIVMTHQTVQTRYALKDVAPRLVLAIVAMNLSPLLISQAISLANAVAQGLLGGIDTQQAVNQLGIAVTESAAGGTFLILLAVAATAMVIVLVCIGFVRAVLVVMLIVSAPLALACHALPQTDHVASLWWRSLVACLSVQIAQALVLVTALRVLFVSNGSSVIGLSASGLVNLLLLICVFWVMLKIPAWAEQLVFSRGGGPINSAHTKAWSAARLAVMAA